MKSARLRISLAAQQEGCIQNSVPSDLETRPTARRRDTRRIVSVYYMSSNDIRPQSSVRTRQTHVRRTVALHSATADGGVLQPNRSLGLSPSGVRVGASPGSGGQAKPDQRSEGEACLLYLTVLPHRERADENSRFMRHDRSARCGDRRSMWCSLYTFFVALFAFQQRSQRQRQWQRQ